MRVGIVTMPLHSNYGGILQNWALQQIIKKLGHEPITIDYRSPYPLYMYFLSVVKTILLAPIPWRRRPLTLYHPVCRRNSIVDTFVKQHICMTTPIQRYSEELVSKYGLEVVITGSDQVWRAKYNSYDGYIEDMFLGFVKHSCVKRLAYAASFGIEKWDYSLQLTQKCRYLAQKMNAISVREKSGIYLCDKYLGVKAEHVLDPTLLLRKEDYEVLCNSIACNKETFLAAYILDMDLEKKIYIDKIANEKHCQVKCFSAHRNLSLSIEEWLSMFRDADYVVTDSFHGMVFSIIFNKPFIAIGNKSRGMARFCSLLEELKLDDRLITLQEQGKIFTPINWERVNLRLEELRCVSFSFLKNNI